MLNEIGVLHFRNGEWEAARVQFEAALARCAGLTPGLLVAWEPLFVNLGHAAQKLGRYEEAIGHFQKALKLAPRVASTHSALGFTLHKCCRFDEAIVHYHRALGIAPNDQLTTEMMNATLKMALTWGGAAALDELDRKYLAAKSSREEAQQRRRGGGGGGDDAEEAEGMAYGAAGEDDNVSVQSLSVASSEGSDMEDSD